MKNLNKILIGLGLCLTACQQPALQYATNMYAKGTLKNYTTPETLPSCPGCHVKNFDRVTLVVDEVLSRSSTTRLVEACNVSVKDSLGLANITTYRSIPTTGIISCADVFEKEKLYLEAMGFSE